MQRTTRPSRQGQGQPLVECLVGGRVGEWVKPGPGAKRGGGATIRGLKTCTTQVW